MWRCYIWCLSGLSAATGFVEDLDYSGIDPVSSLTLFVTWQTIFCNKVSVSGKQVNARVNDSQMFRPRQITLFHLGELIAGFKYI
jgi:hypothetical protein